SLDRQVCPADPVQDANNASACLRWYCFACVSSPPAGARAAAGGTRVLPHRPLSDPYRIPLRVGHPLLSLYLRRSDGVLRLVGGQQRRERAIPEDCWFVARHEESVGKARREFPYREVGIFQVQPAKISMIFRSNPPTVRLEDLSGLP